MASSLWEQEDLAGLAPILVCEDSGKFALACIVRLRLLLALDTPYY